MDYSMLINGEMVTSDKWVDVLNPATEDVFARVPACTEGQLDDAVNAANAAQKGWAKTDMAFRQALVVALADKIVENQDELARLLSQEQGKPLPEAVFEVEWALGFVRHFAMLDLPVEVLQDDDELFVELHHKPLGVVGAIIPWNFPVLMALWKICPAVLAGNAIVLKPAPTTPLTSLKIGEYCQEIFPAGLVNIITDNNDIGPKMTAHPGIAKIGFTGSSETGKKVMASVADTMKRITLEMGGNDPCIVLPDVNVRETAEKVYGGAFTNAGQICIAVKRAYVHSEIYDDFCDELRKLADEAIMGDGLEQGTTIGPIQNKVQYEKVKGYLADAKANGKILSGGEAPAGKGYFIQPTIVRDVKDGQKIVDEEQFGPILPVIPFDDVEDVIERANNSPYGLAGAVHAADVPRAAEIADQIETGTVWVNHQLHLAGHIPFAGYKQSGLGHELGNDALAEFTQTKVVSIAR